MTRIFAGAFGLLAVAPAAMADCDTLKSISVPLAKDTKVVLPSAEVDCPILADNELEEFVIEGGTLRLTGPSTTRFTNLKFTVMDGAGLIFDFAMTEFGPNLGYDREDDYGGYMVEVLSGGSVKFTGEMTATGLENMRSVFWNDPEGSIEFASNVVFNDCDSNVFRTNEGRLRFFGDVNFTDNIYLAIENDGGEVTIDGEALFVANGRAFDGHSGGAFSNSNGGTAIFRGSATFSDNRCDESGGGVYNGEDSKMTFHGKVGIYDNRCYNGDGGGITNYGGDLKFKKGVSVSGNIAAETGGGIATGNGGTTTFYGSTTIQSNTAVTNGGGMSLYNLGDSDDRNVVKFKKSAHVLISLNEKTGDDVGCNNVYVDEHSVIIGGFGNDGTDICDES